MLNPTPCTLNPNKPYTLHPAPHLPIGAFFTHTQHTHTRTHTHTHTHTHTRTRTHTGSPLTWPKTFKQSSETFQSIAGEMPMAFRPLRLSARGKGSTNGTMMVPLVLPFPPIPPAGETPIDVKSGQGLERICKLKDTLPGLTDNHCNFQLVITVSPDGAAPQVEPGHRLDYHMPRAKPARL